MSNQRDNLRTTKWDGRKVMVIRGRNRYRVGRVLRRQAFVAKGRLTLTIRNTSRWATCRTMFATPNQIECID